MSNFDHQGNYKCICGKEFSSSQAFNGHKSRCKVFQLEKHGNLDLYNKCSELAKEAMVISKKKKSEENKKFNLANWISEQHKCERCGKIMTEKFGSGRFCSISCANSKVHSSETKEKIGKSLKNSTKVKRKHDTSKKCYCKICGKEISYKNKTGYCIDCIRKAPELQEYRSNICKNASQYIKNHVSWKSRNITSYSEKFFIEVLNNNNINYIREYVVNIDEKHRYFLDFYIEKNGIKLDLEIDGKQHTYEERIEHDKIRDENLKNLGYTIYRIPWNEINSYDGKELMKNKIEEFLKFYNTLGQ